MGSLRLPKPFTLEEIEALLAEATPDVRAACVFLRETGLRSAEFREITTGEASTWPRPGRWRDRHPRAVLRIVGKGNKERAVVLSREALLAAGELLEVTTNGHLCPWPERTLRDRMQKLGEGVGFKANVHRWRHTWITELVEAGNPIEVVADMAGHSSTDTTRLYYLLSEGRKRDAMERRRAWLSHRR